ncbi:MAG TPA: ComEC/Rec2 family competence protein [Thermoanaerobaculia bacterium]|nr:ComEC/Rec2 family competence protein [Thermoanaerobaculia bacterium]
MELRQVPALLPAAALVAGVALGRLAVSAPPELALALAGAGVAWRGRAGPLLAALAAGLLAATVAPPAALPRPIEPDRPLAAVGRVVDHWRVDGDEASVRFRLTRLRQNVAGAPPRVERSDLEVRLVLPFTGELPPTGSTLRVKGALRRSPGFANGVVTPPGPWRLRVKSPRLVDVVTPPEPLAALSSRWRTRVEAAHREALERIGPTAAEGEPEQGAALARALVLADAGTLPERWRRGLRRAGLAHLLAVSGLHVGLVAGTALLLASPLPWRLRLVVALAAIAAYLLVAGPRPALLRAALMGGLAAVSLLAGRIPSGANALAVTAAALVVGRPALLDDLGFRLTVTATAGILYLAPALARTWAGGRAGEDAGAVGSVFVPNRHSARTDRLRRLVAPPLAATVAAQLVSLPVAAPAFHLVSWTSPLVNLVAIPWTAVALAVSLGWTAAALAAPALAARFVPLLDLVARPFGWPSLGSPGWWGAVPVAAPPGVALVLAALLAVWLPAPWRRLPLLVPVLLLVPAMRWGEAPRIHGGGGRDVLLEAVFLDVGQGDAILLRDGPRALLVDGGGWPSGDLGGRVLVPALLAEGLARLDAVLLTHPDRDHCRGLVDLASYLPIGEVWLAPGDLSADGCAGELRDAVSGQGGSARVVATGDVRAVGRWRLEVLHPPARADQRRAAAGANDASVVALAAVAGHRLLLTGDVEAAAERRLVAERREGLAAEVLKLAHHGSRTSTSPGFLVAVAPRLAIASAGHRNAYGHPATVVRQRLRQRRVPLLRTDHHGMVHLAVAEPVGEGAPPPLRLRLGRPWPLASPDGG